MNRDFLSESKRRELHGKEYAETFDSNQDPMRIGRILGRIEIEQDAVVGDFGCGSGLSLEFLDKKKIRKYYGVDFSKDLLKFALQRKQRLGFENAEFFQQSVDEFAKEHEEQIDTALAMDFSEHVYDDDWLEILKAIRITLKPGGCLYIHTPNAQFILEIMKERNVIVKQFPEHIAVRGPEANRQLLMNSGFLNVSIDFIPHYNFLKHLHWLSHLPLIGKYFRARLFIHAIKV